MWIDIRYYVDRDNYPYLCLVIDRDGMHGSFTDRDIIGRVQLVNNSIIASQRVKMASPTFQCTPFARHGLLDTYKRSILWRLCANGDYDSFMIEVVHLNGNHLRLVDMKGRNALMAVCACVPIHSSTNGPMLRLSAIGDSELDRREKIINELLKKMDIAAIRCIDLTGADASVLLLQAVEWNITPKINSILSVIWKAQGRPWKSFADVLVAATRVYGLYRIANGISPGREFKDKVLSDENQQVVSIATQYQIMKEGKFKELPPTIKTKS